MGGEEHPPNPLTLREGGICTSPSLQPEKTDDGDASERSERSQGMPGGDGRRNHGNHGSKTFKREGYAQVSNATLICQTESPNVRFS